MKRDCDLNDDKSLILCGFADFLREDGAGLDELCRYITHCGIRMQSGMTAGESILAHYRNPLGYDIDLAAMDLRTWPPIARRIHELQTDEAEARAKAKNKSNARSRAKRAECSAAMNGNSGHLPI